MNNIEETNQRSIDFHFRLPRDLEEKLEMYRKQRRHPSLSHTFKYFLKLGIKSTELLEELRDNPSKKENIVAEWNNLLNHITSGDAIENEMGKISDEELETVVMKAFCELELRKRNLRRREFQSQRNSIDSHVESKFMEGTGGIIYTNNFIGPVKPSDPFWS